MDNVLKQLGVDHILSTPYHPQSNWKLEIFHIYLKPTLKKLCEVLASYCVTPNLATAETSFFLVYRRDPNLSLHQLLEPMQQFLGDPDSWCLELESHYLALAITKKNLDENCFKHAQKIMHHTPSNFKVGDSVFFKKQATWQMWSKVESWLQDCLHRVQWTLPADRKSSYWENKTLQCLGCCTQSASQAMECGCNIWQSCKFINHLENLPTITLNTTLKNQKTLLIIKTTLFQFALHRDPSTQGYTLPWVGIIPSSFEGLPYMPLRDHFYSHIN